MEWCQKEYTSCLTYRFHGGWFWRWARELVKIHQPDASFYSRKSSQSEKRKRRWRGYLPEKKRAYSSEREQRREIVTTQVNPSSPLFFSSILFLLPIRDSTTTSKKWFFFVLLLFLISILPPPLFVVALDNQVMERDVDNTTGYTFVFVCYLRCGSASRACSIFWHPSASSSPAPTTTFKLHTCVVVSYVPNGLAYKAMCDSFTTNRFSCMASFLSLSRSSSLSPRPAAVTNSYDLQRAATKRVTSGSYDSKIYRQAFYHPSSSL